MSVRDMTGMYEHPSEKANAVHLDLANDSGGKVYDEPDS